MSAHARHDIADPGLAAEGEARIEWADGQMPVLRSIRERFAASGRSTGVRVAACLHVTAETANARPHAGRGRGARSALCAANPLSTQDDVAAALVERRTAPSVQARRGEDADAYADHVARARERPPHDHARRRRRPHPRCTPVGADAGLLGATEETTTGLVRLRALRVDGRCACPVLAVNEARTERVFNDHYGTGQSALDGILRATNLLLAGRTVVVLGYGWTGRGRRACAPAARARRSSSARSTRCARSRRAWRASSVMPALEAAERGDVFVTVTGSRDVLRREHFERMKDGAVLANAGPLRRRDRPRGPARRSPSRCARCCRSSSSTTSATAG